MWALAVIDAPSDVLSRKRKITPDRLFRAGALAAERARKRVSAALKCNAEAVSVDCTYHGPEKRGGGAEPTLHDEGQICMVHSLGCFGSLGLGSQGLGTDVMIVNCYICVRILGQALHAGGLRCLPWEFKVPLLASNLPAAITQFVPAMRDKGDAVCRAVATPKHYEGKYSTTCLVLEGRTVEHMICA